MSFPLDTEAVLRWTMETFEPVLLARKTFRTGVQSLWRHPDGTYTVSIKNRSYASEQPIPLEKVEVWKELLK